MTRAHSGPKQTLRHRPSRQESLREDSPHLSLHSDNLDDKRILDAYDALEQGAKREVEKLIGTSSWSANIIAEIRLSLPRIQ